MSSYKNIYSEKIYDYVHERLINDGRKASDSTVKTAISDMFYLERRRGDKDFLEWFKSEQTLKDGKRAIEELLIKANRQSSNFDHDLKWYCRLLDYFYDYYKNNGEYVHNDTSEKKYDKKVVRKSSKTFKALVCEKCAGGLEKDGEYWVCKNCGTRYIYD